MNLNNLSLKQKLFIALFIPLALSLYFIFQSAVLGYETKEKLQKQKESLEYKIQLSNIVHEIQIERGLSSFINTKDRNNKLKISKQRKLTDIQISKLKQYSNLDISKTMQFLNEIYNLREKIDNKTLKFNEILSSYIKINKNILNNVANSFLLDEDRYLSQMSIAYINLLRAKEAAGIERAILSNVFDSGILSSKVYRDFGILHSYNKLYVGTHKELINSQQLEFYNKKMKHKDILEVKKLREIAFSQVTKNKIISDIKELAGYGGLIHDFKNYVLRSKELDKNNFFKNYQKVQLLLIEYKAIPTVTKEEIVLINIIDNTFKQYYLGLDRLIKINKTNLTVKDTDKIIKVNDKPAINAINILSNNILGTDGKYWFKVSTTRINIFKSIEDRFVKDMLNAIKIIQEENKKKILMNFLLLVFLIITITTITAKIIYNIFTSITLFQKGLTNFFEYLVDNTITIKPIVVKNNDEFGKISIEINKNINEIKIFLDAKLKYENEQKKKEEQMIQQSRLAQMGEMISMIAHQWRQPLAAISSTSAAINLKTKLNKLDKDSAIRLSDKISDYSQHLSLTIDDFREFFKTNKEKTNTTYNEMIKSVLGIIEISIENKNINLIKQLNSKNTLNTYPNELKQVILNLIKNAEDILIEKNIDNPTITIETKDNILSISDNGGGIPKDIIDKIFDPYFSTKTKKDGTGLGLYMSKTIIEEHCGGKLTVLNDKDGALFTIELKN
ncbi:MAG: hypothetical protein DRG78_23005 [Epsilonproteobacteria bacterium]|nr:MAG: hypothetical protein DRG78_23005 [Campylobacterota bacterium]